MRKRGPFGLSFFAPRTVSRRYGRATLWRVMYHGPHPKGSLKPDDGGWYRTGQCVVIGELAKINYRQQSRPIWQAFYGETSDIIIEAKLPEQPFRFESLWDLWAVAHRN